MSTIANQFVYYCTWEDDCGETYDRCPGHIVIVTEQNTSDFVTVYVDGEEKWFSETGLASMVGFLLRNPYPEQRPDWLEASSRDLRPDDMIKASKERGEHMRTYYQEHLRYPPEVFIPKKKK